MNQLVFKGCGLSKLQTLCLKYAKINVKMSFSFIITIKPKISS